MTAESSSAPANLLSESSQPGAIVVSELDIADFREDAERRIFLRVWRGMRLGGLTRRSR